ncbi:MAG: hypothetical protein U5K69_03075 [Balneolaceae bacterium]|nr:hypothetical protein [Balneolaceae bacterium]
MKHQRRVPHRLFAETQAGIVTRYGDWFHTNGEQIEEFIPGLLEEVDLPELVKAAQAWVKSADSLAMIMLLVLLILVNPIIAILLTIVFHGFWYFYKSSFVVVSLNKPLEYLYKDGTQLLVSLVLISYLGLMGQYLAAGIGLLFFFIFKLGLLRKLWDMIYRSAKKEDELPLNDRVMKMVLVKYSINEDLAPDEIQQMEDQIRDLVTRRKSKKK